LFNQNEIDSFDQLSWRDERKKLLSQIHLFCQKNSITFSSNYSVDTIKSSPHDKIVMTWLFDLVPGIDHWQQINTLCQDLGKICFVITDNLIDIDDFEFVKFFSYPKLLGVTSAYKDIEFTPTQPNKLYNCFIQRVDSVRQTWFYFLHQNNLLDQGYVSLLLKQLSSYSSLTGQALFDHIHKKYQLNALPHFEEAYQKMRDQVPYRNFEEKNNLLPLILDSKYSLVLETYAIDDDCMRWCFTEKSLRSIQFPTVSLLFLQKHGIQKLKELGFEIGSYMDSIDDQPWQHRQRLLIEILANDCIDIDWKQLYNQSKHNQSLLEIWKSEYQKSSFFDNFYNKALQF